MRNNIGFLALVVIVAASAWGTELNNTTVISITNGNNVGTVTSNNNGQVSVNENVGIVCGRNLNANINVTKNDLAATASSFNKNDNQVKVENNPIFVNVNKPTFNNKSKSNNHCGGNNKDKDKGNKQKGNNGVGNGFDPQPPGGPPINDGQGTGPGNPGNKGNKGNK